MSAKDRSSSQGPKAKPTASASAPADSNVIMMGDVKITRHEVEQAFAFFDRNNTGFLRPRDLKQRLSAFYPQMTNKEFRFLISEPNFSVDTLWALLQSNTVTDFDPIKEAFRVYDPQGTGEVDRTVLKSIMGRLGYGDMSDEDLTVLIRAADHNGDGKISLDDFRHMLAANQAE